MPKYCLTCLIIFSYLKILNAAIIPLRPLIPSTSTFQPSTLLLPPGFDSQKIPVQPMLYPYSVSSTTISTRPKFTNIENATPGWIPVTLNVRRDSTLLPTLQSNTSSNPLAAFKDHISNEKPKYSSTSFKERPSIESIVYGTWKPHPSLQPVKKLNIGDNNMSAASLYNKTINRQHAGFIHNVPQDAANGDREILPMPTSNPVENTSKVFLEMISESVLLTKHRKKGRQKIRPLSNATSQNSISRTSYRDGSVPRTTDTTKEIIQHQRNIIKVNLTDTKLMEVAKEINESIENKSNQIETSTYSTDVTTTGNSNDNTAYDDRDEMSFSDSPISTKSNEFFITTPQTDYDDNDHAENIFSIKSATRSSWPRDFMEGSLTTTDVNYQAMNKSDKFDVSTETNPSEIPLALSALNIPHSLWPKLAGNITKLGKPYEAESSAEEESLCVPITLQEPNMMNSKEETYIERVFCFPRPPSKITSKNDMNNFETSFSSSATLKTVTVGKFQNITNFTDTYFKVSNSKSVCKNQFYLLTFILVVYFKLIV